MKHDDDHVRTWDGEWEDQAVTLADDDDRLAPAVADDGDGISASDPFGLYLHQMGSIPMLSRPQELELTGRLDHLRRRYRRAALWNAAVLGRVADTFERSHAGELQLERTVDEVPSLGLTAAKIRLRLPGDVRKLRRLLEEAHKAFRQVLQARSAAARHRLRQAHRRRLLRAVKIAEGLSPRVELLDVWTTNLQPDVIRMSELARPL